MIAFDQVVDEIAGQGDPENRPDDNPRPPAQFAQYIMMQQEHLQSAGPSTRRARRTGA